MNMSEKLGAECEALARRAHSPRGRRAIGAWSAVVEFECEGECACHLVIEDGGLSVRPGAAAAPAVSLTGSPEALCDVLSGRIDATHLLASGALEVRGDYYDMINLGRVAAAVRERGPA